MKNYIRRAIKYFFSLIILMFILFAFMYLTGTAASDNYFETLSSERGIFMLVSLLGLAALYPYFGYTKRTLDVNFEQNKDAVLKVMDLCGYQADHTTQDGEIVFRASTAVKKIKYLGEDTIVLSTQADKMALEGVRKELVRIEYRLRTFLRDNSQD